MTNDEILETTMVWSGDIAPSLDALCRRLSKEVEQMFNCHGELPGILFLFEAPGKGQGRICLSVGSREQKEAAFNDLRQVFARWGVTRYAVAFEAWASDAEKGLRPSDDPERREMMGAFATDGLSEIGVMREIHRPQHGKPTLEELDPGPIGLGGGQALGLLRPRSSSELPDDEGTEFVTRVPNSPIQAMGRRDPTTGELCVDSVYKPGLLSPASILTRSMTKRRVRESRL
jgi:hypothetical protein